MGHNTLMKLSSDEQNLGHFRAVNIYISLHLGKFDWNLNKEY